MPFAKHTPNKRKGYEKRKVRQFLIQRGAHDEAFQLRIIRAFGKTTIERKTPSCEDISNNRWEEFKRFVDSFNVDLLKMAPYT